MHNRKVHSIIGGHIQNQMTLFFSDWYCQFWSQAICFDLLERDWTKRAI